MYTCVCVCTHACVYVSGREREMVNSLYRVYLNKHWWFTNNRKKTSNFCSSINQFQPTILHWCTTERVCLSSAESVVPRWGPILPARKQLVHFGSAHTMYTCMYVCTYVNMAVTRMKEKLTIRGRKTVHWNGFHRTHQSRHNELTIGACMIIEPCLRTRHQHTAANIL